MFAIFRYYINLTNVDKSLLIYIANVIMSIKV